MVLRNSWYEWTAGKLCKCYKSKKILKNIWLQLKLVKIRRHINKGKIVIYTEHYGEIFYCTGRPHFAISKPDFYMNERKCIFFLYQAV
jgi:hypothetical protein